MNQMQILGIHSWGTVRAVPSKFVGDPWKEIVSHVSQANHPDHNYDGKPDMCKIIALFFMQARLTVVINGSNLFPSLHRRHKQQKDAVE